MKKLFAIATLFLLPLTLTAGQYIGIHGGTDYGFRTDIRNSGQKVGYQFGGVYGYDWENQFRTEFELTYRENPRRTNYIVKDDKEESKEHRSSHSLCYMINALYDIAQFSSYSVTPFLGVGVGYGQNTEKQKLQTLTSTSEVKEHDDRFAWQLIAGAKYEFSEKTFVSAKYNFWNGYAHAKNHSFSLGLSRGF